MQTARNLLGNPARTQRWQCAFGNHPLERLTLEKLHDQIGATIIEHTEVGDINDVFMSDVASALGFEQEALLHHRVLRLSQQLDRKRLIEHGVLGTVNNAHASR